MFVSNYNIFLLLGYSTRQFNDSFDFYAFHAWELNGMLDFVNNMEERKQNYINYWGLDTNDNTISLYDEIIQNREKIISEIKSSGMSYFSTVPKYCIGNNPTDDVYLLTEQIRIMDVIKESLDEMERQFNGQFISKLEILRYNTSEKIRGNLYNYSWKIFELQKNLKIKSTVKA